MRTEDSTAFVRFASPEFDELRTLLFSRYPHAEWATFARFGWRATPIGIVLTLAALDRPENGDLDPTVDHVAIQEPYSLRVALAAERHGLAVGVIHSPPRGCAPAPSPVDDDMDSYYGRYFGDFAKGRPYVSAIVSESDGGLSVSARVYWQNRWTTARKVVVERVPVMTWPGDGRAPPPRARTARLASAFGADAAARLRRATVGVVGAGGTGSAAIEVLARAGVGRIVVIDPDHIEASNLERVHGSTPSHATNRAAKAAVARDHVALIDDTCTVVPIVGALPQPEAVDALLEADVVLGCTDQQHSRVALSDLAFRYLVPSIDCGVVLEGNAGRISAQVVQLVRFLAADPCVYCRRMVLPQRLAQELMSDTERASRRLTGRFDPPFGRLQMNLVAPQLEVLDVDDPALEDCVCRRVRGWADVARADALVTAPSHWPAPERV